ncbi:MAG: 2-amino-4-hydroxy-6-hydroxymethyldihydropteridine diphosphokinase [Candidatus Rickettsia vulgarisii]
MIYISIGSNLGDRINNLRTAVHLLTEKYLRNTRLSMVIETEQLPDG